MKIKFYNINGPYEQRFSENVEILATTKSFIVIFNKKEKQIFPKREFKSIMRVVYGGLILWLEINLNWVKCHGMCDYAFVGKNKNK